MHNTLIAAIRSRMVKLVPGGLLVLVCILYVLVPTSPLNMQITYPDSGVFLYSGWRILSGELPYRDVWDHKPPMVFYIDAAGLFIGGGSRWGVWGLEAFSLFMAGVIGYRLIERAFGNMSAISSTVLWVLTLTTVLQGGNLTTEYTLVLQFLSLYLIYDSDKSRFIAWRWFLVGVIGALAFFTKQTTIGIWLAIVLYVTFSRLNQRHIKRWLGEILTLSAGGLVVCFMIVAWFVLHGALHELWSAAFRYNLVYSSSLDGIIDRAKPIIIGIRPLAETGLLQFALVGYCAGVILAFSPFDVLNGRRTLLYVCLIAFPIELLLVSVSGRTYGHYYMALLPILSIFAGVTFWIISSQFTYWKLTRTARVVFQLGLVISFFYVSIDAWLGSALVYRHTKGELAVRYIDMHTSEDDYVLLWGHGPSINFYTKRRSPTRFLYQYPLYSEGYTNEEMILEFLGDITQNQPRLIIDTQDEATPFLRFPIQTKSIDDSTKDLQNSYHVVKKLGEWVVYEYGEKPHEQ